MMYSDLEMIIVSQIAYLDGKEGLTVDQLLDAHIEGGDAESAKKARALRERIDQLPPDQREACENWVIKDVRDDQHGSGMYACMIETEDGKAVIGFRGSESDTLENIVKDWGLSDIGLLNSVLTPQQQAAERYVQDLYWAYGDQYDSFAMTGHSLGGNLAMHGTITAPDSMRDKIDQCVNLDGPGFSNTYLFSHKDDIQESADVMTHYQWSWVGVLMNPVPGVDYKTVDAETPDDILWRHDTYSVKQFDENGNMVPGKKDWLAIALEPLAKVIDFSMFMIGGSVIFSLLYNAADHLKDELMDLWEKWQKIRIAGQKAEFEINPHILSNSLERMSTLSQRIRNICEDAECVQKQLGFDSIAACYVKVKLWRVTTSIEINNGKLERYQHIGTKCGQWCAKYDQMAAEQYMR